MEFTDRFQDDGSNLQVTIEELLPSSIDPINLLGIGEINHPHINKAISMYRKAESVFFVFPWADGGSLQDFWYRQDEPASSPELVSWALEQMSGLADGLKTLHENHFRHCDIKPGNILRFAAGRGRGVLTIANMSAILLEGQSTPDRSIRGRLSAIGANPWTPQHKPPEAGQYILVRPPSRASDVWSMGCVFLEFSIWLLYGKRGLNEFTEAGNFGPYWESSKKKFRVRYFIEDWISKMSHNLPPDSAIRDVLKLIHERLLVIKVNPILSTKVGRAGASELSDTMSRIITRARSDNEYLWNPKWFDSFNATPDFDRGTTSGRVQPENK